MKNDLVGSSINSVEYQPHTTYYSSHPKFDQALIFIAGNYEERISRQALARRLGISSFYLNELFKRYSHLRFHDYVESFRIERAKKLLLAGKMKVHEVALAVGYQDPFHFSRVFKRRMGMPPTLYK